MNHFYKKKYDMSIGSALCIVGLKYHTYNFLIKYSIFKLLFYTILLSS